MSVREAINTSKAASITVAVVIFLLAAAVAIMALKPQANVVITNAYYTDDDGQTYFSDSIYQVPPFDHNGKTAVRAMVFTYDNGSKEYVAFEMRYTDEWKKKLDAVCAQVVKDGKPLSSVPDFNSVELSQDGWEVKAPGPNHSWVPRNGPKASDVLNQPSPDGSPREADVP
jgi:hypothetical protein